MRGIFGLWIAFALGATSTPTRADDAPADAGTADAGAYQPQAVPRCRVFDVPSIGDQVCGYQFLDDVRALYRADAELVLLRVQVRAQAEQIDAERTAREATEEALALRDDTIDKLDKALAVERDLLLKTDKELRAAQGTPWHTWVGWGVAAVAVSGFAGYILADAL